MDEPMVLNKAPSIPPPSGSSTAVSVANHDQAYRGSVHECLTQVRRLQQILDATDPLTNLPTQTFQLGPELGTVSTPSIRPQRLPITPASQPKVGFATQETPCHTERSVASEEADPPATWQTVTTELRDVVALGERWSEAYRDLRQQYECIQARWRMVREVVQEPLVSVKPGVSGATDSLASRDQGAVLPATAPAPDQLSVDSDRSNAADVPHSKRFELKLAQGKEQGLALYANHVDALGHTATKYLAQLESMCVDLNQEASDYEQQIAHLTAVNTQNQQLLQDKDRSIAQYTDTIHTLEECVEQLQTRLTQATAHREDAEQRALVLQQTHQAETRQLHEQVEQQRLAVVQVKQHLQAAANDTEQQLRQMSQTHDKAVKELETQQRTHAHILAERNTTIAQLRHQLHEAQDQALADQQQLRTELEEQRLARQQATQDAQKQAALWQKLNRQHDQLVATLRHALASEAPQSDSPSALGSAIRDRLQHLQQTVTKTSQTCQDLAQTRDQLQLALAESNARHVEQAEQLRQTNHTVKAELSNLLATHQSCAQQQQQMQASITALQANNDHLTQLAQESQKLRSEKSRLARSNHKLSQAVLRAVTRCGEARNQVMWLNSRSQQMHAAWASLLDGFEHQLDRTKTRWWMHRSLVYTGQDQQQTLVARTKDLEAQLHKAQLDHLAVQRQCHSAQEERQQLQARLEHQQALATELEDRCQFWQDKVMTLQRSVTTAIEEKSQAVMESHRVRLELEKSRVVEFTTNGSVCGSVASSRYGGQAPSVSSAVSVTSMVRARRARQHPYLMGHRASTPAPPHRMTPRSHHVIGASGTMQSSGAVTNVAHERSPPLVAPTSTPTGDQWRTTPASPSTMHPPPLPVTKSNLHKKTSEPLLFTTPTPVCPAISSPLANRSPTLFSPRSRTTTRTASLLSQPSKPPPPPGCSLGGGSLDQRQRTESKDLASPLVSPERRASRPSVSPSLRSADPTHALDALGPFTVTGNGTSATPAGNAIASPRLLPLQRRTTDQPITVMFSGFGDTDRYAEHAPDRAYTFTTRDRLTALVSALGGNVYSEHRDFDPTCVTHLITRPTSRTLKTFAAALTGCWVITNYEWVEQSAKVGWFVDEKPFGTRYDARPFAHQQVFIAPSFEQSNQESAAFKIDNIKALVEKYGAGQMVATATDASLCVKADWDRQSYCARDLTWAQFVALIPGSNVKPTRSRKTEP